MEKKDIINRCKYLGNSFIYKFHKIYKEGNSYPNYLSLCQEMQIELDECRNMYLQDRLLTPCNLLDWFFTATKEVDESNGFCSYTEIDTYNSFIIVLASDRNSTVLETANRFIF